MLKVKHLLAASLLAAVVATPAQADMVLDTFEYTDSFLPGGSSTGTHALLPIGDTSKFVGFSEAGGYTEYDLTWTGGDMVNPNVSTGNGAMSFAASSVVDTAELTITYTDPVIALSVPAPVTGIDFADAGEYFYFDIVDFDAAGDFSFNIVVNDIFGGTSTIAVGNNEIPEVDQATDPVYRALLKFSNFTGNADFSSVASVVATFDTTNSADLLLSEVGVVPEPGTLAIFGLGLLGLAGAARRRNA
jgi:hypothetical protein